MMPQEIRALRLSMGLTQEDFAHVVGVTFASVNRWENGKATPSRLAVKILERMAAEKHFTAETAEVAEKRG